VPFVIGVSSCTRFPSASVSVAPRRREAEFLRDVRSVGAISSGISHGSCGSEEKKRGLVDDDDGDNRVGIVVSTVLPVG